MAVRVWWNKRLHHLLSSLHAADNTACFDQDRRARVNAFVAKRKAYMVGYSLVSLQRYAAKQVSKKHQLCSAHHLHCLNVQLEAFAAWRCFLQVRFPFVVVGSILALCHRHEGTTSCVGVLLHHHGTCRTSVLCSQLCHALLISELLLADGFDCPFVLQCTAIACAMSATPCVLLHLFLLSINTPQCDNLLRHGGPVNALLD